MKSDVVYYLLRIDLGNCMTQLKISDADALQYNGQVIHGRALQSRICIFVTETNLSEMIFDLFTFCSINLNSRHMLLFNWSTTTSLNEMIFIIKIFQP